MTDKTRTTCNPKNIQRTRADLRDELIGLVTWLWLVVYPSNLTVWPEPSSSFPPDRRPWNKANTDPKTTPDKGVRGVGDGTNSTVYNTNKITKPKRHKRKRTKSSWFFHDTCLCKSWTTTTTTHYSTHFNFIFFLFYYYLVFSDRILGGNNCCQGGMSDILNIMVSSGVSIVYDWSYWANHSSYTSANHVTLTFTLDRNRLGRPTLTCWSVAS